HRHQHARQGSVYAFRSELDAWRAKRTLLPAEPAEPEETAEAATTTEVFPGRKPAPGFFARHRIVLGGSVLLLVGIAVALAASGRVPRLFGRAASIHSVAVLPFDNLSRDSEQEFFSDGVTDALISDLAQIHALRVISRTTMMRYKGTAKKLPEIGLELGVDAGL